MGAGLAGLSAAITLEQHGISPVIFEKRSRVGDRFINCEILLPLLTKSLHNPLKFFARQNNIYLQPQNNIKKLIIHSENEKAEINGNLGFTNLRGRSDNAFEVQLARQVKSKIIFNSTKTYEQLLQEFTHIILATGDAADACEIQDYDIALTVTLKGAIIEGDFNPRVVLAWLNNKLAPQGYGYLIPVSREKANIVIGFPDHQKNHNNQLFWDRFTGEVAKIIKSKINILSHFEINNYIIGICKYPRIGNTFFTGNNFGSIMPFLGFGQIEAILTGIYAARDISGQENFGKLIKPLQKSFKNSLTLRQNLENLNNRQFDLLVKYLNTGPGQKIVENMVDSKYNYLKIISNFLKPVAFFQNILNKTPSS